MICVQLCVVGRKWNMFLKNLQISLFIPKATLWKKLWLTNNTDKLKGDNDDDDDDNDGHGEGDGDNFNLNLSTIDKLGSWCLKGWWNQAAIRHGEGGIHGNPASGHHQRHHTSHWTQSVEYLPDPILTKGREQREKRLENKASKMTFLTGQQASKLMQSE